jgi:cytochrome c553
MARWLKRSAFVLALALPGVAGAQQPATTPETELLNSKCSLCHTGHRLFTADPAKLKELVDRMEAKNPDWFKGTEKTHLVEALSALLKDPLIKARREAWERTVADGKAYFSDATLGSSGKSCQSCHTPESLREVASDYPKYDPALNRYLSFQERISRMISEKMGGKELLLGDPRSIALETYLKSIR